MLKVLEDVEMMVTTDSEDDQAGAAAGCREMETRRRSHSAINTHHLHINTHLSVAARGLTPTPPRPAPAPDTDYQIFVGRGPSTQEPGARGVRGSDRGHSSLRAMRKSGPAERTIILLLHDVLCHKPNVEKTVNLTQFCFAKIRKLHCSELEISRLAPDGGY